MSPHAVFLEDYKSSKSYRIFNPETSPGFDFSFQRNQKVIQYGSADFASMAFLILFNATA